MSVCVCAHRFVYMPGPSMMRLGTRATEVCTCCDESWRKSRSFYLSFIHISGSISISNNLHVHVFMHRLSIRVLFSRLGLSNRTFYPSMDVDVHLHPSFYLHRVPSMPLHVAIYHLALRVCAGLRLNRLPIAGGLARSFDDVNASLKRCSQPFVPLISDRIRCTF